VSQSGRSVHGKCPIARRSDSRPSSQPHEAKVPGTCWVSALHGKASKTIVTCLVRLSAPRENRSLAATDNAT
jgi:hypothetical protein